MCKLIIKSAMDVNHVIGHKGKLPWHIPEDLKDFKKSTLGKPMIMGRKTFESFNGFLPNRKHIVVTRNTEYTVPPPHQVVNRFTDALAIVMREPEAYVIGGSEIYEQALPFTNSIELTIIHDEFEGDAFFPPLKISEWSLMSSNSQILENKTKLTKLTFDRVNHRL